MLLDQANYVYPQLYNQLKAPNSLILSLPSSHSN